MWVQVIKRRIKPGQEQEWRSLLDEITERVRADRPEWVRTVTLQNQNDPEEYYNVVFFESEAKARERERTPQQDENVRRLEGILDGPSEFVDCIVVSDSAR